MCQTCNVKAFDFEDEQTRPPLISDDLVAAVLLLLWDDTRRGMIDIIRQEWSGTITFTETNRHVMDLITKSGAQAVQLGRQRSGDGSGFDQRDLEFGRRYSEKQRKFIEDFVKDVDDGRYGRAPERGYDSPETREEQERAKNMRKLEQRVRMHANSLIGLANESFVDSLPETEKIYWFMSPYERHCPDCPRLADGSPYTKDTLPSKPKDGSTACMSNCLCWLRTETGKTSFIGLPVEFADGREYIQMLGKEAMDVLDPDGMLWRDSQTNVVFN